MTSIKYHLLENDEGAALTAFIDGQVYTAINTHPNWQSLLDAIRGNKPGEEIVGLFDPATTVTNYFQRVSDRVSLSNGRVFLDGDPLDNGLTSHIVRFIDDNDDDQAQALINFLEKVTTNPNEHSQEQLYDWLSRYDFAITDSGNFLAYKGVQARTGDEYSYESISSGQATVDGKVYTGRIPNDVGAVVEMPRSGVEHDPSVGCHTGLHAGTWEYASNFSGGPVLLVEINPRDVVSVPTDSNWQKIRTCRYTVKEVIQNKLSSSYYELEEDHSEDEDDWSEYDEDSW